jgi:hypothetical protein
VLKAKVELLARFGDDAASVLFLQQELPGLLEAWKAAQAGSGKLDSIVVMDEGISGAVNRGPRAFGEFLSAFQAAFGIDVRALATPAKGDER